jgi:hypothetical protein
MTKGWENTKDQFKVVDVRKLTGNFLPGILNKAGQFEVGEGMRVVQSFEPIGNERHDGLPVKETRS